VFSLVNSSVNTTLPAFAAECHAAALGCGAVAAGRPASVAVDRSFAQQQTCRTPLLRSNDGQTD